METAENKKEKNQELLNRVLLVKVWRKNGILKQELYSGKKEMRNWECWRQNIIRGFT